MDLPREWGAMDTEARAGWCIERLTGMGCDYTLLLYLRHWDFARQCEGLKPLITFIQRLDMASGEASSRQFHRRVCEEFDRRGVAPVAPERFTYSRTKAGAWQKAEQAGWPQPRVMVQFQMRPGPFFVFFSWQDALIFVRQLGTKRSFRVEPVLPDPSITGQVIDYTESRIERLDLLYENQTVNPTRLYLDCDAKEAEFGLPVAILRQLIEKIPLYLYEELLRLKAIRTTDTVQFFLKDKTRDHKASMHICTNILGVSTDDIKRVLNAIFVEPLQEARAVQKTTKTWLHLDRQKFPLGALVDPAPFHGRHQLSTLFVEKHGSTHYPRFVKILTVTDGGKSVTATDVDWAGDPDAHLPTSAHALQSLYHTCFSHPLATMVTLRDTQPISLQINPTVKKVGFALYCKTMRPAVRLELTRAPVCGRQKMGRACQAPRARPSARPGLPPSCHSG